MSSTTGSKVSSASYKFNSFQEIKSHSSILYNERMAILFYLLDMRSINMNTNHSISSALEVRAVIKQLYNNMRMLLRYNPTCRYTLNLETKDPGIYTPDVAISLVDRMIEHCEINGYTTKKIYIICQELNRIQQLLKDILQYFQYFIRPDFKQKPDLDIATEQYKEMADSRTVEQLKALVGRSNKVDFEDLGTSRVDLSLIEEEPQKYIDYDDEEDGEEDDSDGNSEVRVH